MVVKIIKYMIVFFIPVCFFVQPGYAASAKFDDILETIGKQDALFVADPFGRILCQKNADKKLIPASTLKIFTSLVALHHLKDDYRFKTEFYLDPHANLKIKGYGDPMLISEVVDEIARLLVARLDKTQTINHLVVDDAYFQQPLTIPGISSSAQPYDAPNGALCVNFNTVYFERTPNGLVSAEPQTPLLPFAATKIKASGKKSGRIVLTHIEKQISIYAGHLFRYFLEKHGLKINETVILGQVTPAADRLVYRYYSSFSLKEVISKLLEHSNNFVTNQLLIAAGVQAYGPPGTLDKGVQAANRYAQNILKITDMVIVEGSGISRQNRMSARHMGRMLQEFEPYHLLMRQEGREYYKTGSLLGINTRAGYIEDENGDLYNYAVMLNTRGKSTKPVMKKLLKRLDVRNEE